MRQCLPYFQRTTWYANKQRRNHLFHLNDYEISILERFILLSTGRRFVAPAALLLLRVIAF